MLIATILLTIALNALVQLLALGSVERVLVGLVPTGSRGGSGRWDWIRWDEDFGSLLFRVGTASLEATGLRGWGNEVAGVVASVGGGSGHSGEKRAAKEYGVLEVNRAGVMNITHATIVTTTTTTTSNERKGKSTAVDTGAGVGRRRRIRTQHGYMNEIRTVNVRTYEQNSGSGWGWGWRGPEGSVGEWGWYMEMWNFGKQVIVCILGLGALVWSVVSRKKFWMFGRDVEDGEDAGDEEGEEVDDGRAAAEAATYERFLRGEDVSDDEGEWEEGLSDHSEDMDDTNSEDGDGHLSQEAVGLYTDLASTSGAESSHGSGVGAATLLAHMTHQGGSPLTRRKYRTLVRRESGDEDEELFGRSGGTFYRFSQLLNPLIHEFWS